MRLFKKKNYIRRPEFEGRLKKLGHQVDNKLERGSKIMREHHLELFQKPDHNSGLMHSHLTLMKAFGVDPGKPEPKSRLTQLERKLDLVLNELGLQIDWHSQVTKPHYTIQKKAAPKKATQKGALAKKAKGRR